MKLSGRASGLAARETRPFRRAAPAVGSFILASLLSGLGYNAATNRPHAPDDPVVLQLGAHVEVLLDEAAEVELWIPIPGSDESQEVDVNELEVNVTGRPPEWELTRDAHGNHFVHLRGDSPRGRFEVSYAVPVRRHSEGHGDEAGLERVIDSVTASSSGTLSYPYQGSVEEGLASIDDAAGAEHLVGAVLDRILRSVTAADDPLRQAVALNEVLRRNGQYIKTGAYGQGDATWFCLTGQGNCTDFHFTYLEVAERIDLPVRFRVGIPLSPDPEQPAPRSGTIPGYHCWVYLGGSLRFGIDPAWESRLSAPTGTYFGRPLNDRIKLSEGTDLSLSPAIHGEPLPFMFEAYAESNGAPIERIYGAADDPSGSARYVRTTYRFTRTD